MTNSRWRLNECYYRRGRYARTRGILADGAIGLARLKFGPDHYRRSSTDKRRILSPDDAAVAYECGAPANVCNFTSNERDTFAEYADNTMKIIRTRVTVWSTTLL